MYWDVFSPEQWQARQDEYEAELARQKALEARTLDFFEQIYDLSKHLTQGKTRVTVKFQAHPGRMAGGVYGVRLMNKE